MRGMLPQEPTIEQDRLLRDDELVLEGVDISGEWNTFMQPRVNPDYDNALFKEVQALPYGETIGLCWQCGMCTATCTVTPLMPLFQPHYFIYIFRTGNIQEIKRRADLMWHCVGCYKCTQACPKGVNVAEVVEAMSEVTERHFPELISKVDKDAHEIYHSEILGKGRLSFQFLGLNFFRKTGRIKEMWTNKMYREMAIHQNLDRRAIYGTLLLGRPRGWGKFRKVIHKYLDDLKEVR